MATRPFRAGLVRALRALVLLAAALALAPTQSEAANVIYTYDMLGRVTRVDYPNGNATLYTYDAAGNRTAVSTSVLSASPTAVDDPSISTNENTAVTFDPRGNDISSSAMTIIATGAPLHGSVAINGGTSFTYTPATGYYGVDTFYYTITNGSGGQSYALDTVTIAQTFPPPTASPFSEETNANTPVTFDPRVHATGDGLSVTGTPTASHGSVVNNSGASLTYTPNTDYVGGDSFTYTVTDTHSQSAGNTVTMTIDAPTPPAPPCNQTFSNTHPPHQITFDCRADPALVTTAITQPATGTGSAALNTDGTITYTAPTGFTGLADFTYTVKNSFNVTATGNVEVNVTGSGL